MIPLLLAFFFFFQSPDEPKLATVEGKVIHAASKMPIRKAKVTLTGLGFDSGTSVETSDDGKFNFKDVKPGRYRLTTEKTGYETTAYGARKPGEALGQVLRIDPGAAFTGMDLTMPKHGVIAGRILDADQEPVPRALVMAMANIYYGNGRRGRIPRGTIPVMSNDLGEFRIGSLPPGQYVVCAIPVNYYQPTPDAKEVKPAAEEIGVTTCFPNVAQMSEASPLEIKDSTEIPGIDIRLTKTRTVTVQGQITGVPASAGSVTILNLNRKGAGPMGNAIHPRAYVMTAEGKFQFKNVAPGSYVMHTLPTGLGNAPFVVKMNVDIGDQPVKDLAVPALIPYEIKAKLVAEPGPELKLPSIRLILTPTDEITSAVAMGTANADGDITLANVVSGRYRVVFTGLPQTHYLRELRAGDQVAEGDEIDIAAPNTLLSLSFVQAKGEITGIAQNEKDEPVVGAHVALIPEPRRPYRIRATRTDQNGTFKLGNVAPGDYVMVALDSVESGALEDEEYVKPIRPQLKKVTVGQGAVTMKLTVIAAPELK